MASTDKDLIGVLTSSRKAPVSQKYSDGSRLLLLPYGARVLGLFAPSSDESFFWTHPALATAASAEALFQSHDWHNTGGDRTWLAPEVDVFFPNFPATAVWHVPPQLDPGNYAAIDTAPTLQARLASFPDPLARPQESRGADQQTVAPGAEPAAPRARLERTRRRHLCRLHAGDAPGITDRHL